MPVVIANAKERGFDNSLARLKLRLIDPATNEFLHMSGQGRTNDIAWSWLGFQYQADTLRSRAEARGESWPFITVHRDLLEPQSDG